MQGPQSTLLLLVTCSRDESRRDLAVAVAKNLAALAPAAGLDRGFVAFDNASIFDDHLAHLPPGTVICRCERNVGYWSAIKWVLDNRFKLFNREFEHLYIVESDLHHSDLVALRACESFLASEPRASGVRTQEFSVRGRWRFDKRLSFLPGYRSRSAIQMSNAITGEKAWFRRASAQSPVYLSNLHAKLPALSRLSALDAVFAQLAAMDGFTESDFFRLMMDCHPCIGVYDGGLFHSLIAWEDRNVSLGGSYSDPADLMKVGYQPTRIASIEPATFGVRLEHAAA